MPSLSTLRHPLRSLSCLLDLKLAVRMLVKYPGLTIVGCLAMAFAIGAGAAAAEVVKRAIAPNLPLPEGDRIVGFKLVDRVQGNGVPIRAYDFLNFREQLRTVREIGAYRLKQQNILAGGVVGAPVSVAEISASAFRLTRVSALLGRVLLDTDEAPGAPPVVVLGYRLWQTRFAGDRGVLGREVRLGETQATVVGVMPEGFLFPVDDNLWTPLPVAELSREPARGPALHVFGRLADGVDLAEARAEVASLLARSALAWPQHYAHVASQVLPYTESVLSIPSEGRAGVFAVNLFTGLFLVVVSGNVALLMFARAATREKELLVRTALGATRGRIIGMLFLEALVLAAIAAVVGLGAAALLLRGATQMLRAGPERWPFWFDGGLSATTILYAGLLALLAAAIAGVVPGLKVMGRGLWDRMRQSGAGGGGLRMGGVWTGVIIVQIAAVVLFTAVAFVVHRQASHIASADAGFPAKQFLSARIEMDALRSDEGSGTRAEESRLRYTATVKELERRLLAQPGVMNATLAEQLPGMPGPVHRIEVEDAAETERSSRRSIQTAVAPDFFDVFQMPLLAGRTFDSRDSGRNANTVVVNETFAEQVLQGQNAIGRRIRIAASRDSDPARSTAETGPWLEIVGVVRDLVPREAAPLNLDNPKRARFYRPLTLQADGNPVYLAVQARADVETFVPVIRRVASEVSPLLRLHDLQTLDNATSEDERFWTVFARIVAVGSMLTLGLSLAGIYSVMSFTVSRRTREIGVRTALGGRPLRVITEIFRRPFRQIGVGIFLGWVVLTSVVGLAAHGSVSSMLRHAPLLLAHGIVIAFVCTLACLGPIARALRVQPIEALRDDG